MLRMIPNMTRTTLSLNVTAVGSVCMVCTANKIQENVTKDITKNVTTLLATLHTFSAMMWCSCDLIRAKSALSS